jgi:hypothetical protein
MRKFLMGLVGCVFLSAPANAEGTVNEVLARANERSTQLIVASTADGISWSNSYLTMMKQQPMYCPPQKLAITVSQYMDILRRHVQEIPADGHDPIGFGLLNALQKTFPCPQ